MKRNRNLIALGTILGLAAVAPAGAATPATQATCDALLKQADAALVAHKGDAKAKAAEEQRAKGATECKAGNFAKGAEHLRTAIADLGMKPVN
jgi:hypothetical protein